MNISHHPDVSTLLTCSAGSQPEALCAVVVSHLALCQSCSEEFHRLETIGEVLFCDQPQNQPVAAVASPTLLDEAHGGEALVPNQSNEASREVPRTIVEVIGSDLDALDWQRLSDGIEHFAVELSDGARGDLRLLRIAPGATLPEHGHVGEELTLVLRGAYVDQSGEHGIGDFADLDDRTRHEVTATGNSSCIILVGSETVPGFVAAPRVGR